MGLLEPLVVELATHELEALLEGRLEWERAGFQDYFNRPGGPSTPMDRSVWCQG